MLEERPTVELKGKREQVALYAALDAGATTREPTGPRITRVVP